nr:MAG TPA: hypothetical protein [Caudoviricetes sp.]
MNIQVTTIILSISILINLFTLLIILIQCKRLSITKQSMQAQIDTKQKQILNQKSKLTLVEYHVKNYKEGNNIFTEMRDISNIISK